MSSLSNIVNFVLFALFLLNSIRCHVIPDKQLSNSEKGFSPYFAAFSDEMIKDMVEYERLKRSLVKFHAMDWNEIAKVKAFESKSSSWSEQKKRDKKINIYVSKPK